MASTATHHTSSAICARIRSLPLHRQLKIVFYLCNKYRNTPDSLVPPAVRPLFGRFKDFVTSTLVCSDPILHAEYRANLTEVVLLVNRPPPPSGFPKTGLWIGLATRFEGVLVCTLQTYLVVQRNVLRVVHTRDTVALMPKNNTSIAKEEAQMLLDFACAGV